MLRPLANFEAYYLTDVDVDTASKQMKKYDQLVFGPKENRWSRKFHALEWKLNL